METICITGISGYLGRATAFKLAEAGYRVIGIGTQKDVLTILGCHQYIQCDIRDTDKLTEILKRFDVKTVFHFAAVKYVGQCESEPEYCHEVNVGGTKSVLAAMKLANVFHIVYASTYAVYEWIGDDVLLTESTPTKPATVYGTSKLAAELEIIKAHQAGEIKVFHILRYGNIVGCIREIAYQSVQSFIDKLVIAAKNNSGVQLNGNTFATSDGAAERDFIDIRDVVSVHRLVLKQSDSGVLNIATGKPTSLNVIVEELEKLSGKSIDRAYQKRSMSEPSRITINIKAAQTSLGWQPQFTVLNSVNELFNYAHFSEK